MDSKILLLLGGSLLLWAGAAGAYTGEAWLMFGLILPKLRFKRAVSPVRFWLSVALYLGIVGGWLGWLWCDFLSGGRKPTSRKRDVGRAGGA
jgi:hypothetical protein